MRWRRWVPAQASILPAAPTAWPARTTLGTPWRRQVAARAGTPPAEPTACQATEGRSNSPKSTPSQSPHARLRLRPSPRKRQTSQAHHRQQAVHPHQVLATLASSLEDESPLLAETCVRRNWGTPSHQHQSCATRARPTTSAVADDGSNWNEFFTSSKHASLVSLLCLLGSIPFTSNERASPLLRRANARDTSG
jgi:hypothetical protein